MKSFYCANSGEQVHLREDGSLEFQIRMKKGPVIPTHRTNGERSYRLGSLEVSYQQWLLKGGFTKLRFFTQKAIGWKLNPSKCCTLINRDEQITILPRRRPGNIYQGVSLEPISIG